MPAGYLYNEYLSVGEIMLSLARIVFILLIAQAASVQASAAPAIAHGLPALSPLHLAGGCGLGVRRGPGGECTPVFIHRRHRAYWRGYHDGYRDGYEQGYFDGAYPYVDDPPYYYYTPGIVHCGLGYSVTCAFGICGRRCW